MSKNKNLSNSGKHLCGKNYAFFFFPNMLFEEMRKKLVDECIKIGGEDCPLVNHAKMASFVNGHIYKNIEAAKSAAYVYSISQITRGYTDKSKDWQWVVCVKYEGDAVVPVE